VDEIVGAAESLLEEALGDDDALLELDKDQSKLLRWWCEERPKKRLDRAAVLAAYTALVAEYLAWKAIHYDGALPLVDRYHALLVVLTKDTYAPWKAHDEGGVWECEFCEGALALGDEPGDSYHKPTCPWLVARQLVQP
jgi:hypothetical protein